MGKTELLEKLRKTIEQDPTYFIKAKTDKSLNNIRPEVNQLLYEIEQKAKNRALSAIAEAETSFSRAPTIISNAERAFHNLRKNSVLRSKTTYEESKTKYKDAQNKLELAKRKVASGEYIALLEAKQIAEDSQNVVNESFRLVNSAIDIATNEEERAIKEEKHRKKEKTKNIIITIISSPLLILKAWLVGIIGLIIGAVIGFIIGVILTSGWTETADNISGIFALIGFIIVGLGTLIDDIQKINKT